MRMARLVACVTVAIVGLNAGSALWGQNGFDAFLAGKSDIRDVDSNSAMPWTSHSSRPGELPLGGSVHGSLSNLPTIVPQTAAVIQPTSDEPFSIARQAEVEVLASGISTVTRAEISAPTQVDIARLSAVSTSMAAPLISEATQLITPGIIGEDLQPVALPVSNGDALLQEDTAPHWLPTATTH